MGVVKIMDTDGDSKRRKTRMYPQNLPVPLGLGGERRGSYINALFVL